MYDSWNLMLFNITWTSLPIFVFGLLEQNIKSKHLLNNPGLYRRISKNYLMSLREFLLWFLYGLWHSVAIFFGWYLFFNTGLNLTSKGLDNYHGNLEDFLHFIFVVLDSLEKFSFGFCVYSTVVPMVNIKLWFQSRSWNFPLVASIIFSILIYIVFNIGLAFLRINTGVLNFFTGSGFNTDVISTFPPEPDIFRYSYFTDTDMRQTGPIQGDSMLLAPVL